MADVDSLRVLQAPAEKELTWSHKSGQPRYPFNRQYREAFRYEKPDPKIHADSLGKYLQVAPHLRPSVPELSVPIPRHPDVQPNNVFISEKIQSHQPHRLATCCYPSKVPRGWDAKQFPELRRSRVESFVASSSPNKLRVTERFRANAGPRSVPSPTRAFLVPRIYSSIKPKALARSQG